MRSYPVHEAKARLSQLLRDVEAGEEVVITRAGRPVARVCAIASAPARPEDHGFGSLAGAIVLREGWDAPMTEEELADWYGGPVAPPA